MNKLTPQLETKEHGVYGQKYEAQAPGHLKEICQLWSGRRRARGSDRLLYHARCGWVRIVIRRRKDNGHELDMDISGSLDESRGLTEMPKREMCIWAPTTPYSCSWNRSPPAYSSKHFSSSHGGYLRNSSCPERARLSFVRNGH
jgi:hypothetical protein